MRFLLDTNALIDFINKPDGKVAGVALKHRSEDVVTSSIIIHELYFGAFNSSRDAKNVSVLDALLLKVVNYDHGDARQAGRVRAWLVRQGKPIGPYDILIAGQALERGLVMVTHNAREFARVPGLICEDWSG